MRILVLTQAFDEADPLLGFFVGWIERLAGRVSSVQVIAGRVGATAPPANVTVHSLGKERQLGRFSRQLRLQRLLARILLRQRSADVVLCHMVPAYALAAAPYARAAGAPVFLWYTHGRGSRALTLAERLVSGILTASSEGFPLSSPKLTAVGHGIDLRRFGPQQLPANGRRAVLSLGRLSPIKAHEVTIEAFATVLRQQRIEDLELRIVGEAPLPSQRSYAAELARLVASRGIEPHVRFVGAIPHAQVEAELAACVVFVSASQTGSLDKAPLEAMACGRVALVSGDAYRAELDGFEDLLTFRSGDSAHLADRLTAVLRTDRGSLETIGRELSQRIHRRHDLDRMIERILEIFRHAL
jgi:glycosyltransferase involved in cell wall biosynthesis